MKLVIYKTECAKCYYKIHLSTKQRIIIIDNGLIWGEYKKKKDVQNELVQILINLKNCDTINHILYMNTVSIRNIRLFNDRLSARTYKNILCS